MSNTINIPDNLADLLSKSAMYEITDYEGCEMSYRQALANFLRKVGLEGADLNFTSLGVVEVKHFAYKTYAVVEAIQLDNEYSYIFEVAVHNVVTYEEMFKSISEWQDKTFPTQLTAGKSAHLMKEAKELHEAVLNGDKPNTEEEISDNLILLVGIAHRSGIDAGQTIRNVMKKLEILKVRNWGPENEDGSFQHI